MLKRRGSLTNSDYIVNHNLDMKYEMFLRWLQHVENNASSAVFLPIDERMEDNGFDDSVITSDEDNDNDEFLDTDADYPTISFADTESVSGARAMSFVSDCCESDLNDGAGKSTRDLVAVHPHADYDSSSSEFSAVASSEKSAKRKAKHNKGRAPPVPRLPVNDVDHEATEEHKTEKKTLRSFLPNIFRSQSPAMHAVPESLSDTILETDI